MEPGSEAWRLAWMYPPKVHVLENWIPQGHFVVIDLSPFHPCILSVRAKNVALDCRMLRSVWPNNTAPWLARADSWHQPEILGSHLKLSWHGTWPVSLGRWWDHLLACSKENKWTKYWMVMRAHSYKHCHQIFCTLSFPNTSKMTLPCFSVLALSIVL